MVGGGRRDILEWVSCMSFVVLPMNIPVAIIRRELTSE